MSASLYDSYDQNHKRWTLPQRISGGKRRAATAKRDRYGRLLPNDDTVSLPEPQRHGSAGGLALLRKYGREYFSNLAKKKGLKP